MKLRTFVIGVLVLVALSAGEAVIQLVLIPKLGVESTGLQFALRIAVDGPIVLSVFEKADRLLELTQKYTGWELLDASPKLKIEIARASEGKFGKQITFKEDRDRLSGDLTFYGRIINAQEATVAAGLHARLEFYWDGEMDVGSISFKPPRRSPGTWAQERTSVTMKKPATLAFAGRQDARCPSIQPLHLGAFTLRMQEWANGHFDVFVKLASSKPFSQAEEELRISVVAKK